MGLGINPTEKRKYLYLLGKEHALKFLRGGCSLRSVLSRNDKLQCLYMNHFGDLHRTVGDYYAAHAGAVKTMDMSPWLSNLAQTQDPELGL